MSFSERQLSAAPQAPRPVSLNPESPALLQDTEKNIGSRPRNCPETGSLLVIRQSNGCAYLFKRKSADLIISRYSTSNDAHKDSFFTKRTLVLSAAFFFLAVASFRFMTGFADDADAISFDKDGFIYQTTSVDEEVTVTGTELTSGNLEIPSSVDYDGKTYKVTSIGNSAFYGCSGFTGNLTIPSGVTTIGDYAFQNCSGFTGSLTIPSSVTSIGDYAFYGANSLSGLTFAGESLPAIGSNAFNFNTTSTEKPYDLKFQSNRPLPDELKYNYTKFQCEIIWNVGGTSHTLKHVYGTLPEYDGTTPVSTPDGNFYTWNPAVEEVTGPKEYTVAYKEITVDFGGVDYYYTGSPITPEVTVKIGSVELEKDTDYEISYSETYVGSATVTIKGIGKYGGTVEKGFEILKAKLTITAEDKAVVFSEAAPEFTAKYEGFVSGDDESVLVGTLEFDCGYDGSVHAETFDIMPKGLTSDNYDITFVKGTLSFVEATIDIPTAVSGLTYNGAEQTGVPEGDGYTITGNTGIYPGDYSATLTLNDGYAWSDGSVDAKTVEWSIAKAKLTITAEDKTVTFSEAAPGFTAKYEGFVNDENESALGGTLEFDCGYDGSVYAETFDITPKGLTSDNYDITFAKGTLTVVSNAPAENTGVSLGVIAATVAVLSTAAAGSMYWVLRRK
jgi:hypothetical protein